MNWLINNTDRLIAGINQLINGLSRLINDSRGVRTMLALDMATRTKTASCSSVIGIIFLTSDLLRACHARVHTHIMHIYIYIYI